MNIFPFLPPCISRGFLLAPGHVAPSRNTAAEWLRRVSWRLCPPGEHSLPPGFINHPRGTSWEVRSVRLWDRLPSLALTTWELAQLEENVQVQSGVPAKYSFTDQTKFWVQEAYVPGCHDHGLGLISGDHLKDKCLKIEPLQRTLPFTRSVRSRAIFLNVKNAPLSGRSTHLKIPLKCDFLKHLQVVPLLWFSH